MSQYVPGATISHLIKRGEQSINFGISAECNCSHSVDHFPAKTNHDIIGVSCGDVSMM